MVIKRKLTFFEHICGNSKSTFTKDFIQCRMKENRKQGRPRTNYIQNMRTWTGLSNRDVHDTIYKRDEWKDVVQKAIRAANTDGDAGQCVSEWPPKTLCVEKHWSPKLLVCWKALITKKTVFLKALITKDFVFLKHCAPITLFIWIALITKNLFIW